MKPVEEIIFVGLPGPAHSYGGLSGDNVASTKNRGLVSHPREALLQSLALMRRLLCLGIVVGVLPPQIRPHMGLLRTQFEGMDEEVIRQAALQNPALLEKASSSSVMWAANAATITPASDASDGRTHITTANLYTNLHRRIEAEDSAKVQAAIFSGGDFALHPPLDARLGLLDEGAANHMRFAPVHGAPGLNVFVYGVDGRQSFAASRMVAETHKLNPEHTLFLQQSPEAILSGVFHNDVIAVGNEYMLICHEKAFAGGREDIGKIRQVYRRMHSGSELNVITVAANELSLSEAVETYFFNSQLVTRPDGGMALIVPQEAAQHAGAARLSQRILEDEANPVREVIALDLRQSMRNGGGPACLRLRAVLKQEEIAAIARHSRVLADEALLAALEKWALSHYPETLGASDLADPRLLSISRAALEELGTILALPLKA